MRVAIENPDAPFTEFFNDIGYVELWSMTIRISRMRVPILPSLASTDILASLTLYTHFL